jgi:hypothetical protein
MAWDIDDLLGIDEPEDLNTQYLEEAQALTSNERDKNIAATKLARDNIMSQVNVDVEDSTFGADLNELTDYAWFNSVNAKKQTEMTANRMGANISPALQKTIDRQQRVGGAMTAVDARNTNRVEMREDRMDNMAKAIGMEDDLLQMELDRLGGLQDVENVKHGMPSNGSSFSLGAGFKGGMAAYTASGKNVAAGVIGAILGAFY